MKTKFLTILSILLILRQLSANDFYLNVDGKEYSFPPIPAKTERFDLCTRTGNRMIGDIELKNPEKTDDPSTAHVPEEFIKAANIKDDGKGLETPRWNAADAHLKGVFAGYKPEMDFWIEFTPDNIITGKSWKKCVTGVNPDGTFELDVPVLVTRQLWFRVSSGYHKMDEISYDFRLRNLGMTKNIFAGFIVLSPDEETRICIDLPAHFRQKANQQSDSKIFYFAGAHAEINNLYYDYGADYRTYHTKIFNTVFDIGKNAEIAGMTPSEYKERVINAKKQCFAEINAHPSLTLKMKEFFRLSLEYYAAYCLDNIKTTIKIARLREGTYHTDIEPNKEYYSYLNDLPLNNPVSLYFFDYAGKLNRGGWMTIHDEQIPLSDITGISEGLFFDLIKCREICSLLDFKPLPEEKIERLKQMKEPFYEQIILAQNEEILAKIEYNQSRKDYHAHDVQGKENDELFEAIIGKEKGKVVLVDFWAGSGGPFRPLVPHKDKFDPDKVVFVYLTDETTSIDRWNYIIPDFSGEHYRLSNKQYEYMEKRFQLDLHTSLVLLDKNSERITLPGGLFFTVQSILDEIYRKTTNILP